MFNLVRLGFGFLVRLFRSRESLLIENLVLRQQLAVFKRKHSRPRLAVMDKCFWIVVRRCLVFVENSPNCGYTGYRGPLAPCGLAPLFAPFVFVRL